MGQTDVIDYSVTPYDWRNQLIRFVYSMLGRPFEWGRCDCTIFALQCLDVITGGDHASQAEGRWHDRKSAYRFSIECGFTVENYLIRECGARDVSNDRLSLGDFILIDQVVRNRKLWKRPAIYMGVNRAAIVDHDGGAGCPHSCGARKIGLDGELVAGKPDCFGGDLSRQGHAKSPETAWRCS